MITKEVRFYPVVDKTLGKNLLPEIPIYRIPEWHLRSKQPSSEQPSQSDTIGGCELLSRIRRWAHRLTHTLDYVWIFPALWRGMQLIRREHVDVILTSYPTEDALVVGLLLKLFTGKKWIVDFRDPWVSSPYVRLSRAQGSFLRLSVDTMLERFMLSMADAVIVVGELMRKDLISHFGQSMESKTHIIYNGYDPSDFDVVVKEIPKGCHGCHDWPLAMIHLGSWQYHRTPEHFLRALGQLLRTREYLRDKIRVDFVGGVRYDSDLERRIPEVIQQEDLTDVVRIVGYLGYRNGLSRLMSSDVALLVQGEIPDMPGVTGYMISSKLFEYLYLRKPILALVPPQGEPAQIIRTCNAGMVVSPTNMDGIEQAIFELYQSFRRGELGINLNVVELEKFDRKKQVSQLATVFDSITG